MVVCHWYKTERDLGCNKDGTYSEGSRMRNRLRMPCGDRITR